MDRFVTFDIIKQHIPQLKEPVSEIIKQELALGNFDGEEYTIAQTSIYLRHVDFSSINEK